jgi:hypothetical protein
LAVLTIASVTLADIISGSFSTHSSADITVTQVTIDKPSSVVQGDLLLANIAINGGSPATVTGVPSGWTQILRTDNDTNISIVSYYKIAGASEPANYTWNISPQTRAEGGITRYSGVDTSNPIDSAAGNFGLSQVATTSSITTSAANEEIVALFATDVGKNTDAGSYFSTPTGMTEKYDVSNITLGPSTASDDVIQVSLGNSGSKSSTISGNKDRNWASQVIALKNAGPAASTVAVLVVAGGGGGEAHTTFAGGAGGGGGGGYQYDATHFIATGSYSVTSGAPGVGGSFGANNGTADGFDGGNSVFDTITAIGGGGGGSSNNHPGSAGGSGGGGAWNASGGSGTVGQGNNGGAGGHGSPYAAGGGGGAGAVGATAPTTSTGGDGGSGTANSISGSSVMYAGGGGGGGGTVAGAGGAGGGGAGSLAGVNATDGAANTGGGGGGAGGTGSGQTEANGGNGGSGVVIIAYPTGAITATGGTVTTVGGNTIHTFDSSGTFTVVSIPPRPKQALVED